MEEQELVTLIGRGDMQAFHWLYDRYKIRLASKIYTMVRSRPATEDLLQEVFMRIWENRSRINPGKAFDAYLYKVTGNLVYDYFRKLNNHSTFLSHERRVCEAAHLYVDEAIERKETQEQLNRGIDNLPEKCRQVFVMFMLEQKSYLEITTMLGLSKSTVKNHLFHAKKVIRRYLGPHHSKG